MKNVKEDLEIEALEFTESMTVNEIEDEIQRLEELEFLLPDEKRELDLLNEAYSHYVSKNFRP